MMNSGTNLHFSHVCHMSDVEVSEISDGQGTLSPMRGRVRRLN
jgi:hypothetical protein